MSVTFEQAPYLHADENLSDLTASEMLLALEKKENRQEVWSNIQALLRHPENEKFVVGLRTICEQSIAHVKSDASYVQKLLTLGWEANGTYWGKQVYPDGSLPSDRDRSVYGVLCLYDQIMFQEKQSDRYGGLTPGGSWKGKGLFADAQFWLQHSPSVGSKDTSSGDAEETGLSSDLSVVSKDNADDLFVSVDSGDNTNHSNPVVQKDTSGLEMDVSVTDNDDVPLLTTTKNPGGPSPDMSIGNPKNIYHPPVTKDARGSSVAENNDNITVPVDTAIDQVSPDNIDNDNTQDGTTEDTNKNETLPLAPTVSKESIDQQRDLLLSDFAALQTAHLLWKDDLTPSYRFVKNFQPLYPNKDVLQIRSLTDDSVVLEIGLVSTGQDAGIMTVGKGSIVYQQGFKLNIAALANKKIFNSVVDTIDAQIGVGSGADDGDTVGVDVTAPSQDVSVPLQETPAGDIAVPVPQDPTVIEGTNPIMEEKNRWDVIHKDLTLLYGDRLNYDQILFLKNTVEHLIVTEPAVGEKLLISLQQDAFFDIAKYALDIQNAMTKKSMIDQLLLLGLSDQNLEGVTLSQISAGVLKIRDIELKKTVLSYLIVGNVSYVGSLLGMKKNSEYINNRLRSDAKFDSYMLHSMEHKNRVYRGYEKILGSTVLSNEFGMTGSVPNDVKEIYLQFAYKDLAHSYKTDFTSGISNVPSRHIDTHSSYAIVSKTDGNVYLFDENHNLVSKKSVLLGKDRNDSYYDTKDYVTRNPETGGYKVNPPSRTPRGLYTMDNRYFANANIGKFMQLVPQDGQMRYATDKNGNYLWALGFHQIYKPELSTRDSALRSANSHDKFMTNGCINIHDDYFSELRDHLDKGSQVYIT